MASGDAKAALVAPLRLVVGRRYYTFHHCYCRHVTSSLHHGIRHMRALCRRLDEVAKRLVICLIDRYFIDYSIKKIVVCH